MQTKSQAATTRAMAVVSEMRTKVNEAALQFEARWTLGNLATRNSDLYDAMVEQIEIFDDACRAMNDSGEIKEAGEALVRGYVKCWSEMQAPPIGDIALQSNLQPLQGLARCPDSGTRVLVGPKALADHAAVQGAFWFSPEEIAGLVTGTAAGKALLEAKRMMPRAAGSIRKHKPLPYPTFPPEGHETELDIPNSENEI